jgi:hypothetical protein
MRPISYAILLAAVAGCSNETQVTQPYLSRVRVGEWRVAGAAHARRPS